MDNRNILECEHITKEFPGVKALDDVSFELEKGEVHALCGENGAGKSTLIKIITGMYQRDKGIIRFEGKEVDFKNAQECRKNRQPSGRLLYYRCEKYSGSDTHFRFISLGLLHKSWP